MKYPIGPETIRKARKTVEGQLALLLNELLYDADYADVTLQGTKEVVRRWVTGPQLFIGDNCKDLPESLRVPGEPNYIATEALIREIRDRLEFLSYRNVIP